MQFPPPPDHHVRSVPPAGPPAAFYRPTASAPPPRRRLGLRLAVAAAIVAVSGGGVAAARVQYLPTADVLPGLAVGGERVPEGASEGDLRALLEARAERARARKVRLLVPGEREPALVSTLGELGVDVDVDRTLRVALRYGKEGDVWTRALAARAAKEGTVDVPLSWTLDRDRALAPVSAVKEATDMQAVSARLDLDKHATIPERDGRYVDADGAIAALEAAAWSSGDARGAGSVEGQPLDVELPVATFPPRVSSAFLKSLVIDEVVAEYETFFSRGGEQRRRGKNIDTASQKLDGLVLMSGEMISFNAVVGERSEANGFQKSWEIFKGEMVEGVGGGTCQVASTLHAAAFFGGLEILERLPHSRPSAYIPMGLDSTVVYPGVDLKLRNPHPFPVVVHAKTEGGKLRVELLGKERPVTVSFKRDLESTLPYKRKIVEDATLSGNKVLVKQHGIKGFKMKRSRVLRYSDGNTRTEETRDVYPPTTEIYHVPVGFDVALLPSVPGGGEDADLGGNPSAAPAVARTPSAPSAAAATACTDCASPGDGLEFVDAPGAHAPTSSQVNPSKNMTLRR